MSSRLLRVASEQSSVVAVVGKGHLQGIKKHWKQPVEVSEIFPCLRLFSRKRCIHLLTDQEFLIAVLLIWVSPLTGFPVRVIVSLN